MLVKIVVPSQTCTFPMLRTLMHLHTITDVFLLCVLHGLVAMASMRSDLIYIYHMFLKMGLCYLFASKWKNKIVTIFLVSLSYLLLTCQFFKFSSGDTEYICSCFVFSYESSVQPELHWDLFSMSVLQ